MMLSAAYQPGGATRAAVVRLRHWVGVRPCCIGFKVRSSRGELASLFGPNKNVGHHRPRQMKCNNIYAPAQRGRVGWRCAHAGTEDRREQPCAAPQSNIASPRTELAALAASGIDDHFSSCRLAGGQADKLAPGHAAATTCSLLVQAGVATHSFE